MDGIAVAATPDGAWPKARLSSPWGTARRSTTSAYPRGSNFNGRRFVLIEKVHTSAFNLCQIRIVHKLAESTFHWRTGGICDVCEVNWRCKLAD